MALWRLRGYLRPHQGHLILITVIGLASTLVGIGVPLVTRRMVDGLVLHGSDDLLLPLFLLALLFGLAEAGLIFLRRLLSPVMSLAVESEIRDDVYWRLLRLPLSFHDRWPPGQLLQRATGDLASIRSFVSLGLPFLIVNTVTVLTIAAVLLALSWFLGLLVIVTAFVAASILHQQERVYRCRVRAAQQQEGELTTHVQESVYGIQTVLAFGRRKLVRERFDLQAEELRERHVDRLRVFAWMSTISEGYPNVLLGLIVLTGALAIEADVLTIGDLVAFVGIFSLLLWPIQSFSGLLALLEEAESAAERILHILAAPLPRSVQRGVMTTNESGERKGVRICFEQVGFRYPENERPILSDITLELASGEMVALVGPTGSGKTTLTMLLSRLREPTHGRILIDGIDSADLPLDQLRSLVAMTFDEPLLFSGSIRENLMFGASNANDDEILAALRIAHAEFVLDLPDGLETNLQEGGGSLSGGQRQRLALARALLTCPRVLVLDDPLSALDPHTNQQIEQDLWQATKETTVLVVTHRSAVAALADRVILLNRDGSLGAVGRHKELVSANADYRRLLGLDRPGTESAL